MGGKRVKQKKVNRDAKNFVYMFKKKKIVVMLKVCHETSIYQWWIDEIQYIPHFYM